VASRRSPAARSASSLTGHDGITRRRRSIEVRRRPLTNLIQTDTAHQLRQQRRPALTRPAR
jgi:hypothetical protein